MTGQKITTTIFTTEASLSHERSQVEIEAQDPESLAIGSLIIEKNVISTEKESEKLASPPLSKCK